MDIKYFDELNSNKLEGYYSKEIELDSGKIDIDLNFDSQSLSNEQAEKLNTGLKELPNIIKNSWQWIMNDYKNGVDVSEFISFHLDDFFEDDLEEILKGTDSNLDNKDRFLQTLRVNRVGVYPDSPEHYMIIDWMTDPELSNYILVIVCNAKLELEHITVES